MSERLSNTGEREQTGDFENKWDMSDAPTFDPEAAQRRAEAEKPNSFEAEDLQKLDKLQEQLEQMGAREEIVNNPAFQRELNNIASNYGLRTARMVTSEGVQDGEAGKNLLVDCDLSNPNTRKVQNKSRFSFQVLPNGNLTISSARAERDADRKLDFKNGAFRDYEGGLIDEQGLISVIKKENVSQVTTFEMSEDGQQMVVNKLRISEDNTKPVDHRGTYNEMTCFADRSELNRVFDNDGVEQWRTYVGYVPYDRKINARAEDWQNDLDSAKLEYEIPSYMVNEEVEEKETYRRTSEEMMDISYYKRGFAPIELKDVKIRGEHENELVPNNEAGFEIRKALDEQMKARE